MAVDAGGGKETLALGWGLDPDAELSGDIAPKVVDDDAGRTSEDELEAGA